jgi:hypothetical protein
MKGYSFWFRVLSIVIACFQNMTMGGILFGWTSISGGLLTGSIESGGAGLSEERVNVHSLLLVAVPCSHVSCCFFVRRCL